MGGPPPGIWDSCWGCKWRDEAYTSLPLPYLLGGCAPPPQLLMCVSDHVCLCGGVNVCVCVCVPYERLPVCACHVCMFGEVCGCPCMSVSLCALVCVRLCAFVYLSMSRVCLCVLRMYVFACLCALYVVCTTLCAHACVSVGTSMSTPACVVCLCEHVASACICMCPCVLSVSVRVVCGSWVWVCARMWSVYVCSLYVWCACVSLRGSVCARCVARGCGESYRADTRVSPAGFQAS